MLKSTLYVHKFIEDCTIGRIIQWIDENFEGAYSLGIAKCSQAIKQAHDYDEIRAIDERWLDLLKQMVAAYRESEEYSAAIEIESNHFLSEEPKGELEPLGMIIHNHRQLRKIKMDDSNA